MKETLVFKFLKGWEFSIDNELEGYLWCIKIDHCVRESDGYIGLVGKSTAGNEVYHISENSLFELLATGETVMYCGGNDEYKNVYKLTR